MILYEISENGVDIIIVDDGTKTTILDYMRELNWD